MWSDVTSSGHSGSCCLPHNNLLLPKVVLSSYLPDHRVDVSHETKVQGIKKVVNADKSTEQCW
jgi:hypothetical protein